MKTNKMQTEVDQLDQDQMVKIYDTYHLHIYRNIVRQTGDVELARDLTADVFQRLLQALQKGHGPNRNVKAWLYRTAHNLVIDHYRRRQLRDHDPLGKELAAGTPDPAQTAENNILAETVRTALDNLTPDQRQVITLKYLDGLSNQEVAHIMDKSTGAVKSLQHRALTALRRELRLIEESEQTAAMPKQETGSKKEKGMDSMESIPKSHQPLSIVTSSL